MIDPFKLLFDEHNYECIMNSNWIWLKNVQRMVITYYISVIGLSMFIDNQKQKQNQKSGNYSTVSVSNGDDEKYHICFECKKYG